MNEQFSVISQLQYENKNLKEKVKTFENGSRFLKIQDDYRRVCGGYERELQRLRREVEKVRQEGIKTRDKWYEVSCDTWNEFIKETSKYEDNMQKLRMENWELYKTYDDKIEELKRKHKEETEEKDAIIEALTAEIKHLKAVQDRDGTNTSVPTSQTPIGKTKVIPNGRENTGCCKGGVTGHVKTEMAVPEEDEITDTEEHLLEEDDVCPKCKNEDFEFTGETVDRYETEVEVKVKKVKHVFYVYVCNVCGQKVICRTPPEKRTKSRYGANVQALILVLLNVMNSSINKVPRFLEGVSNGEIKPCEGYVAKVQARAAKHLTEFHDDLRRRMLRQGLLYWDDTVVFADTKRICLRFYGDERIAFYVAHDHKDMEGLLKDGILENLSKETKVMHDHNRVNYNEKFVFQNLECVAHLQRALQKIADETDHQILLKIKEMISSTIKDRKKLIEKGIEKFDDKYLADFDEKLSEYIS
ncbi:MAG: transposase, partial [archaeon]|nr:transposase [archaeon]